MDKLYIPTKRPIIKLETQPDFPRTDLSENNTDMLKEVLINGDAREGLRAHAEQLEEAQRYIHLIGDRAMKVLGVKARYDEDELRSFSHGFASFETISAVVQPPRLYDMKAAMRAVHELFVDTTDGVELEHRELILAMAENRDPQPIQRDRPFVEFELADRHSAWASQNPNTYDVIVEIGNKRSEKMRQIHARTMGAHVAYLLQASMLDEAA